MEQAQTRAAPLWRLGNISPLVYVANGPAPTVAKRLKTAKNKTKVRQSLSLNATRRFDVATLLESGTGRLPRTGRQYWQEPVRRRPSNTREQSEIREQTAGTERISRLRADPKAVYIFGHAVGVHVKGARSWVLRQKRELKIQSRVGVSLDFVTTYV